MGYRVIIFVKKILYGYIAYYKQRESEVSVPTCGINEYTERGKQ